MVAAPGRLNFADERRRSEQNEHIVTQHHFESGWFVGIWSRDRANSDPVGALMLAARPNRRYSDNAPLVGLKNQALWADNQSTQFGVSNAATLLVRLTRVLDFCGVYLDISAFTTGIPDLDILKIWFARLQVNDDLAENDLAVGWDANGR